MVYLIEAVYAFVKPEESYHYFSIDFPFYAYVIFKILAGVAFLYLFKMERDKEKLS